MHGSGARARSRALVARDDGFGDYSVAATVVLGSSGGTHVRVLLADSDEDGLVSDYAFSDLSNVENPAARVYHNAAQSIPNNSLTTLSFNSERYDRGDLHSTATNNSRLTAPEDGIYMITGHIEWGANANGTRLIYVTHSVDGTIAGNRIQAVSGGQQSISTVYEMTGGEYVELGVLQTSGGALNVVSSGNDSPEFTMTKIG